LWKGTCAMLLETLCVAMLLAVGDGAGAASGGEAAAVAKEVCPCRGGGDCAKGGCGSASACGAACSKTIAAVEKTCDDCEKTLAAVDQACATCAKVLGV